MLREKDKIRIKRFIANFEVINSFNFGYRFPDSSMRAFNLYPTSKSWEFKKLSFGCLSNAEIIERQYQTSFLHYVKHLNATIYNVVKESHLLACPQAYDENEYILQLYKIWIVVLIIDRDQSENQQFDHLLSQNINFLESLYDEINAQTRLQNKTNFSILSLFPRWFQSLFGLNKCD